MAGKNVDDDELGSSEDCTVNVGTNIQNKAWKFDRQGTRRQELVFSVRLNNTHSEPEYDTSRDAKTEEWCARIKSTATGEGSFYANVEINGHFLGG